MIDIKNVYCIGRNYSEHVKELKNELAETPLIFSKPTHSVVIANENKIKLPKGRGEIHHELELVLEMDQDYDPNLSVDELIYTMYVGLDLTLRDLQTELKEKELPWLLSKGFVNSAILSKPFRFPGLKEVLKTPFSLDVNGEIVQQGKMEEMIFELEDLLKYLHEHIGLKKGDIIFTGTPKGVGPLKNGDKLQLIYDDQIYGLCTIEI